MVDKKGILFYVTQKKSYKKPSNEIDDTNIDTRRKISIEELMKIKFPEPEWEIEDNRR